MTADCVLEPGVRPETKLPSHVTQARTGEVHRIVGPHVSVLNVLRYLVANNQIYDRVPAGKQRSLSKVIDKAAIWYRVNKLQIIKHSRYILHPDNANVLYQMSNKTVQRLLQESRRGHPIDSSMLRDMGVSAALAAHMVKSGWLQRLSQGVYLLTGDTPSRDGSITYLGRCIPGLHVGGKTALSWQGVRHNIAFREKIVLWGQKSYRIPPWVAEHLSYSYQTTTLFDDDFPYEKGLKPLPAGAPEVLVSVPERAILELASDIGKGQSMEEASNLMVGLRNLRPDVLDEFLSHCKRVKVVRLVRDLGLEADFSWARDLQKHVDRLGAGKRWSNKTKNGRLTLKPR